jgi:hypothetical protein
MRGALRRLQVLAWLAVWVGAGVALAQTSSDKAAAAESLFREGKGLMSDGRMAEACDKFAASQKLDPALGTLMNLADCLERSGKTASAWAEFLNAATQARRSGQAERASVAESRAAALEPRLCRMKISAPADVRFEGLELRRDGSLLDPAIWNTAVPVDPGAHRVSASAPGRVAWSTTVDVVGEGKTASIEVPKLELAPVAAASSASPPLAAPVQPVATASAAASPPTRADRGMHIQTTLGLVVGGLGVVGIAAGSYWGLAARSKWADADCAGNVCPTQDRQTLAGDAKREANVSTVAFVGGGVLLGAGLVLILTAPKSPSTNERAAAHRRGFTVAPLVDGRGAGVNIGGIF